MAASSSWASRVSSTEDRTEPARASPWATLADCSSTPGSRGMGSSMAPGMRSRTRSRTRSGSRCRSRPSSPRWAMARPSRSVPSTSASRRRRRRGRLRVPARPRRAPDPDRGVAQGPAGSARRCVAARRTWAAARPSRHRAPAPVGTCGRPHRSRDVRRPGSDRRHPAARRRHSRAARERARTRASAGQDAPRGPTTQMGPWRYTPWRTSFIIAPGNGSSGGRSSGDRSRPMRTTPPTRRSSGARRRRRRSRPAGAAAEGLRR